MYKTASSEVDCEYRSCAQENRAERINMNNLERKFGKYAIRDLSLKLIILYAVGYLIYYVQSSLLYLLTLDPYSIVHGQIWRIVSWLLVPPSSSNIFFTVIMLYFYYVIGTSLERVWGTWRYNVFILTGVLLTVAAAFAWLGVSYLTGAATAQVDAATYFRYYSMAFSTYYINMSIFLAYAMTFPEAQVLLFFIIPIKVKYLGILDAVYLLYELIFYAGPSRFIIAATLLNVVLLWWRTNGASMIRRNQFKNSYNAGMRGAGTGFTSSFGRNNAHKNKTGADGSTYDTGHASSGRRTIHKCAICGRTEEDAPNLDFRYCSKCEGGYEYCSDHLFTHVHVQGKEKPHMVPPSQT